MNRIPIPTIIQDLIRAGVPATACEPVRVWLEAAACPLFGRAHYYTTIRTTNGTTGGVHYVERCACGERLTRSPGAAPPQNTRRPDAAR